MRKPINRYDVPAERAHLMRRSMHDGVPVWCDCCSCEAEPYWADAGDECAVRKTDDKAAAPAAGRKR